ncbi:5-formyltetrahydrofolate cyclo-ligase [Geomonas sp. RF6]|uniref:5-formyltetrahydrofolate cyclo-ligase n=1 Tax=Geomonas sp. RF6 TaxID=2897342 RepID=UPI001E3C0B78|nr:5-formyltetrahydrofolate cyclo-ligase [Geomonas sp. RF6]UFS68765.1 5-formyltetrahydrofolate cyclo-ligase [Geomonas sp. RF6]
MPKRSLRSGALARRGELTPAEVASLSDAVQRRFLSLPEFAAASTVALYSPIRNEVETSLVAREALRLGKELLFPAVVGPELEFRRVAALSDLARGAFGILEPQGEPRHPLTADLIVVPGVAFDLFGRRIGYGRGFYDRALHRMEGSGRLVGFCYDFQLVEEIAGEPHDVMMDLVVTEAAAVRVKKI